MKTLARRLLALIVAALVVVGGAAIFLYSGAYNIAADVPHWPLTQSVLHTLRERSVDVRTSAIKVPDDLDDPQRVRAGAERYAAMCVQCHLAPGEKDTDLRRGLYPRPPDLTKEHVGAQEAYWVIRHGIKMSAMPAWGLTHDNYAIWELVAFIQKMPDMNPQEYRDLAAQEAGAGHAHAGVRVEHGHGETDSEARSKSGASPAPRAELHGDADFTAPAHADHGAVDHAAADGHQDAGSGTVQAASATAPDATPAAPADSGTTR